MDLLLSDVWFFIKPIFSILFYSSKREENKSLPPKSKAETMHGLKFRPHTIVLRL